MILLDTNVVSALMSDDHAIDQWLSSVRVDELYTTAMTVGEIRYGLARLPDGKRKSDLTRRADDLFHEIGDRVLAFDSKAADHYGQLLASREGEGRPISIPDAIIASIAAVNRASLATRNVRDFDGCRIEVIDPFRLVAP